MCTFLPYLPSFLSILYHDNLGQYHSLIFSSPSFLPRVFLESPFHTSTIHRAQVTFNTFKRMAMHQTISKGFIMKVDEASSVNFLKWAPISGS
jgi:hypothetical protein